MTKLQSPRNTTVYSLGRTNSFRASSHALFENKGMGFAGFGGNLQNISDDLRAIYISDEGYKLGQVDQSGAEARIVAYLASPGKYRDLFIYDIKPHVYVGLHLFKDVWKQKAPELDIDGLCLLSTSTLKDHPQWKLIDRLIKSSDKWPASERYYYLAKQTCHCVDKDTEVLTKDGWMSVAIKPKRIQTFKLLDWTTSYEDVIWNEFDYEGPMYYFLGQNASQFVTPNHTVPHWSSIVSASDTRMSNLIVAEQKAEHIYERTIRCCLLNCNYQDIKPTLINKVDNWKGKVYCPTTSTGYFVMRRDGKVSITHNSSNYGIKAPTFMLNTLEKSGGKIALSRKDAEFFLNFYRATFPEIVQWNVDTYEFYLKYNKLFNLFGHPREFCGGEDAEKIYAFVPQSTVGEITHMAIRDMQNFIEAEKKDWHILQNNHDSYLMEFPEAEETEAMSYMRKFIEIDFVAPDGSNFSMKSEGKTGWNWRDLKELQHDK